MFSRFPTEFAGEIAGFLMQASLPLAKLMLMTWVLNSDVLLGITNVYLNAFGK